MARIHYFVHGRGQGHATRSLPVIEALREDGHEVEVFAGESAFPVLSEALSCVAVKSLMPGMGFGLLPLLLTRVIDAQRALRRSQTDLVVSDGDLPGILAATLSGRPSIAVGHAEIFSTCRRPSCTPRGPWLREAARAWVSAPTATGHVAVNFIALTPRSRRTIVARPVVPDVALGRGERSDVVCYFRDNNGDDVLRSLRELGRRPILFSAIPIRVQGVDVRPLGREAFLSSLGGAEAVVASAGSQLISECVLFGIPIFALFDEGDDEQRVNVSMLRASGFGDGCTFTDIQTSHLGAFLRRAKGHGERQRCFLPQDDVASAMCRLSRMMVARSYVVR